MIERYSPRLIVVAGPNGTGKTSITEQLLLHKWMTGCEYAKSLANCSLIARIADRSYLYDNSIEGEQARLLFRVANGMLIKLYGPINPMGAGNSGFAKHGAK